ncbi:MAG: hypothetical protein FWG90_04285 [Oscillospiraceae bacterium]|nr:hypothetical protein [Oscillospiraceae bacterium]
MDIKEKIGGFFIKDKKEKFENIIKTALKRHNFSIAGVNKEDEFKYEITSGTAVFTVNVRELRKLYNLAHTEEEIESLIVEAEEFFLTESKMISFTNAQTLLRLLIMRDDEVKNEFVSADFIQGLKKVVVYTSDDVNLNILDEAFLKKWGVPREVILPVADRNMCRLLEKAEIVESSINETRVLELKLPSKELCVSMLMCSDLRKTVCQYFGEKFLAVAPSRENLLILEDVTKDMLEGLGSVIINEYRKAANPLTTGVMLFTQNDIEAIGYFSVAKASEEGGVEDA